MQTDIPFVFRIRDGQPNTEALRMELTEVQAAFRVGEDGCVTATLTNPCLSVTYEPVSYTHLDVYKRQPLAEDQSHYKQVVELMREMYEKGLISPEYDILTEEQINQIYISGEWLFCWGTAQ